MTAKTIAILHQKGGVGKTTLALNLAREAQERGQRALVVDSDPQRTTANFRELRAEQANLPALPIIELSTSNIHNELPALSSGYDRVFIDTSAGISQRSISAIKAADIVLIPTAPAAPDLWSCEGIFRLVQEVNSTAKEQKLSLVVYNLTYANARSLTAVRAVEDQIASTYGVNFIASTIMRRAAWSAVMWSGRSILEGKGKDHDPKAIQDLKDVYSALEEYLAALDAERDKLRVATA